MFAVAALSAGTFAQPVSVALLGQGGASHSERTAHEIRRETIHIEAIGRFEPNSPPPQVSVVVAWVEPGATADALTEITQWLEGAETPVGLIGCAPEGSTRLREEALAAGFDDFVTGEISVRELAARVRALARRIATPVQPTKGGLSFGNLVFDGVRYQVWVSGRSVRLTRTQLAVMRALIAAKGRPLTRRQILDAAWEEDLDVGERAVDNVILRLRRKLGEPNLIVTVRGVGFRLADN